MSNKNQKKPIASFDEVRSLIDELPGPDYDSRSAAVEREAKLTTLVQATSREPLYDKKSIAIDYRGSDSSYN